MGIRGMMRQLLASAAAVTLLIGGGASSAFAQAAGNAGSGTSQTGTPPPSTGQPPPAGGTSASPQPAQTLPEVQVIQEQQKAQRITERAIKNPAVLAEQRGIFKLDSTPSPH